MLHNTSTIALRYRRILLVYQQNASYERSFATSSFLRCAQSSDSVNRIALSSRPAPSAHPLSSPAFGPARGLQLKKTSMTVQTNRPLSPFLTYRWTLTMVLSIVHRITGIALYVGTLLMAWWLIAAASGPTAYANIQGFTQSWIGRLILFGYTWALLHHMLGGLRHFVWDLGYGFGPTEREWLTRAVLIGSISLTLLVWIVAYAVGGGR
jgi:succinate dehydrogenase / fumarate reductase cytochrome b subunit